MIPRYGGRLNSLFPLPRYVVAWHCRYERCYDSYYLVTLHFAPLLDSLLLFCLIYPVVPTTLPRLIYVYEPVVIIYSTHGYVDAVDLRCR